MELKKEIEVYDYLGQYENSDYDTQMKMLKEFLLLSGEYSKQLKEGISIERIYRVAADKHKLKYVDNKGVYHYTYEEQKKLCQEEMTPWDKETVDKHIYAIAYAYAKTNLNESDCRIGIINKKIKEMKRNTMDDLFFYDLVYLIRKKFGLYIKEDKEAEERIILRQKLIPKEIGKHTFYETPVFNNEFNDFIEKVSSKISISLDGKDDLFKYRYVADKELEEFTPFIKK